MWLACLQGPIALTMQQKKDKSGNVIYSKSLVKSSCLHYWEYAPVHKRVALHYVIGNMHQHTGGLHYWQYASANRRVALLGICISIEEGCITLHYWEYAIGRGCNKKANKKTPEGVYAGCVGVRKNYRYVEWQWKVEECMQQMCAGEMEMFC